MHRCFSESRVFELSARVAAVHNAHDDRSAAVCSSARLQRGASLLGSRAWSVWPGSAGVTKHGEWLLWNDVARSRGLFHLRCDLGARYRRLWRPGVALVPDTSFELFASNSAVRMPKRQVSGQAREICAARGSWRAYLAGLRRELHKHARDAKRCAVANLRKGEGLRNPALGV